MKLITVGLIVASAAVALYLVRRSFMGRPTTEGVLFIVVLGLLNGWLLAALDPWLWISLVHIVVTSACGIYWQRRQTERVKREVEESGQKLSLSLVQGGYFAWLAYLVTTMAGTSLYRHLL